MTEAYDYGFSLPTLVRYKLDNYIGELDIEATDAEGNAVQLLDDPADYKLSDRCTADVRTRMEDYTRRFLPLYIAFMSNTNHNAYDNYARVKPYLLPGSDLESRFYNAIVGQTWSHSQGDVLHDVVVNGVFEISENKYLIDVDYKVDTTGSGITTENDAGMLIVAIDQGKAGYTAGKLAEQAENFGVYVLRTSSGLGAPEVFAAYKRRWGIETLYHYVKNVAGFENLKVEDYYKEQGMAFVMLVCGRIHARVIAAVRSLGDSTTSVRDVLLKARRMKLVRRGKGWELANTRAKDLALFAKMGFEPVRYLAAE